MADIIVAFPKLDDAKNLRKLLIKNGYDVNMVCDSGSQVIDAVNRLDGGIVISGYRFSDMYYMEINDYLPKGFQMLLLASPAKLVDCDVRNLLSLAMPFKVQDLLNTLEMMMVQYNRWRKKKKNKPKVIDVFFRLYRQVRKVFAEQTGELLKRRSSLLNTQSTESVS